MSIGNPSAFRLSAAPSLGLTASERTTTRSAPRIYWEEVTDVTRHAVVFYRQANLARSADRISSVFLCDGAISRRQGVVTLGDMGGGGVLSGLVVRLPITSVGSIQICNNNLVGLVAVRVDALGSCSARPRLASSLSRSRGGHGGARAAHG